MLSIIVATAKNRVIGNKGKIPWHLPDDFKYFAEKTKNKVVIVGKTTFQSILDLNHKPLPNRTHIVLGGDFADTYDNVFDVNSIEGAQNKAEELSNNQEIFVIGGASIYEQFLSLSNKVYLTEVDCEPIGDTFFPKLKENEWVLISEIAHERDARHDYKFKFKTYVRK